MRSSLDKAFAVNPGATQSHRPGVDVSRVPRRMLGRPACVIVGVWCSWTAVGAVGQQNATAPASAPASRPAVATRPAPTESNIREAIRQLSHPVPVRRRAAVRQLAQWGAVAFPELRRVAKSGDIEAALSAQALLRELESAILIGAEVRLEVDRPRAAWDEPIMLVVHARNPSSENIVVPWPAPRAPATQPAVEEARQVGALLDAADFLIVTGPDGEALDPRVDPIERDSLVNAAVNVRARGTPPTHPMTAGATADLRIPHFNRGWARYLFLEPGQYTIQFSYQPEWNDPSWTRDGFGLVRSEPITVEITRPAPDSIRLGHTPLRLTVRKEGTTYVAELESTWDRDQSVNLNFGERNESHAVLEWRLRYAKPENQDDDSVCILAERRNQPYRAESFRRVRPGERLVIDTITEEKLRARARESASEKPELSELTARYVQLPTPEQLREALAERNEKAEVPRDLFSGVVTSEAIAYDGK